jgi:hypothetical protein
MRTAVAGLLVLMVGCAAAPPRLTRTASEWRIDGHDYVVDAAAQGGPMPDGWILRNYEPDNGAFQKTDKKDRLDFSFGRERDDGALVVVSRRLPAEDQKKELRVLLDRELNAMRMAGALLARVPNGRSFEFRTLSPPRPMVIDGAEAYEIQLETALTGVTEPLRNVWFVLARSLTGDTLLSVTYSNTPSRFPNALDDAKGFLNRLHLEADRLQAQAQLHRH